MLRNDIEHKLTNTILSPLEAQRLAINMRMIENARKAQSHQPVWLQNSYPSASGQPVAAVSWIPDSIGDR